MGKPLKGGMTFQEAGRKGGKKTAKRHGHEFYVEIGRKGGQKVLEMYGVEHYEQIGYIGGQKVKVLIAEAKRAREKEGK